MCYTGLLKVLAEVAAEEAARRVKID